MESVKGVGAFNPISNGYEVEKIFLLTGSLDKMGCMLKDGKKTLVRLRTYSPDPSDNILVV